MKKSIKQLLSAVLVIAMMASLLVVPAAAAGPVTGDDGSKTWDFRVDSADDYDATKEGLTVTGDTRHDGSYGMRIGSSGSIKVTVDGNCTVELLVGNSYDINVDGVSKSGNPSGAASETVTFNHAGTGEHELAIGFGSSVTTYIASLTITPVEELDPEVTVSSTEITNAKVGQTTTLTVGIDNADGKDVTWSYDVDDNEVVTDVTGADGSVSFKGAKAGKATLTITATVEGKAYTKDVTIFVQPAQIGELEPGTIDLRDKTVYYTNGMIEWPASGVAYNGPQHGVELNTAAAKVTVPAGKTYTLNITTCQFNSAKKEDGSGVDGAIEVDGVEVTKSDDTDPVFTVPNVQGEVTLTAVGKVYIHKIEVVDVAATRLEVKPTTVVVKENASEALTVTAENFDTDMSLFAVSADAATAIAVVDEGVVTVQGVKAGKTTVYVGMAKTAPADADAAKDVENVVEVQVTVMEATTGPVTKWDFGAADFTDAKYAKNTPEEYNGLVFSQDGNASKQADQEGSPKPHVMLKSNGTITVPVSGPCGIAVTTYYSNGGKATVGEDELACSGNATVTDHFYYNGADKTVTITGVTSTVYIKSIELFDTVWTFPQADIAAAVGNNEYKGLKLTSVTAENQAGKDHAVMNNGSKIEIPVPGKCNVNVTCYYGAAGTVGDEALVTASTSAGATATYHYAGEAGYVEINTTGQTYVKKIELTAYTNPAAQLELSAERAELTLGGEAVEITAEVVNGTADGDMTATVAEGGADIVTAAVAEGKITLTPGTVAGKTTVTVSVPAKNSKGEANTATADIAVEVTDPNVTPTFWDFRETTYTTQTEYKGAKIANGKAHGSQSTYGMVLDPVFEGGQLAEGGAANITIPVDGPATIVVYVGYRWDVSVGDAQTIDRYGSDKIMEGDNGKYVPKEFTYTGGKGEVVVTANTGSTYIAAIEVKPIEGMTANRVEVYDFGAAALNTGIFDNKLTAEVINGWYPGVEPGKTGEKIDKFPVTAGDLSLSMSEGGYLDFRNTNPALTCQATNNVTKAEVEPGDDPYEPTRGKYDSVMFSGVTDAEYTVALANTKKGDKLTYAVGEGGKKAFDLTFTDPSGAVTVLPYTPSSKGGALLTIYAAADGTATAMANFSKPGFARIYREPGVKVAVSGSLTAAGIPAGYKLVFTNDESGVTYDATVSGSSYTVELDNYLAGASYTLSVADAEGWIVADGEKLALELADRTVTHDVTLANVDRVKVTGKVAGLTETDLANLVLVVTKPEDKVYLPKIVPEADGSFSVLFEKGVEYGLAALNVNDYELAKDKLTFTADKTENIVFTPVTTYAITMAPDPATVDLSNATITFVNVADTDDKHPDGYTYTFTGDQGIKLRDGQYKVTVKGTSAAQKLTPDLVVSGADTDCPVPFNVDAYVPAGTHSYKAITDNSYADAVVGTAFEGFQAHTGGHGPYGGASSTLTLNMEKPGKVVIEACRYGQGNDLTLPEGATVEVSTVTEGTASEGKEDNLANVYTISGVAAGKQTITFGSGVYLHSLTVQYESPLVTEDQTLTVGADKQYKTVNEALKAVEAMNRAAGVRATIVIDPGDYEEQVIVKSANVTLKNAAATPSLELKNKGVDIDDNAVRITWYYGHGYDYYSMTTGGVYDADVLAVNKANGYQSYTNGGGNQGQTFWNSTLSVLADGFRAEGIIFENSFNQYQSKKAAEDVIVPQAGQAKEGAVPRAQLKAGDTAVQDRAYVERAAAVGVANGAGKAYFENCKVIGRQDALFGGTGVKMAFYKGAVYGGTDYIMGPMAAVFVQTDLVLNTSEDKNDVAHITAPQQGAGQRGYLFWNCHITSTTPGVDTASTLRAKPSDLGRPWDKNGEAVFYETNVDATDPAYYGSEAYKGATGAMATSILMADGYTNGLGGFGTQTRMGEMNNNEYYEGAYNEAGRKAAGFGKIFTEAKTADGQAFDYATWLGDWNPYEGKTITLNKQVAKPFDATALKADLEEAIATAKRVQAEEVTVVAADTAAADVDRGVKFVKQADKDTFAAAITAAEGVNAKTDATVDEVLDAVKTLAAAVKTYQAAVKDGTKAPDTTGLQASLAAAAAAKDGVVTSSGPADKVAKDVPFAAKTDFDALNAAVKAAQTVADSATATQKDVDDAKAALDAAVTAFNAAKGVGTKVADAASLKAAIEEAKAAKDAVVVNAGPADQVDAGTKFVTDQAVIDALDAAIKAAQAVADKANATQAELDAALKALTIAKADFDASVQTGTNGAATDKSALEAAIAEAEGVYAIGSDVKVLPAGTKTSAVDKGQKFVTQDVYDALAAAIEAAKAVLADPSATEEDIAKAVADLAAAKDALKVQTGTKSTGGSGGVSGGTASTGTTTTTKTNANGDTVKKTTDRDGNVTYTVTSKDGEVLATVVLPASISALDKKFKDVPDDHWAASAINDLAAQGMVKGVADEIYDMPSPVTRGSLATILFRLAQGKAGLTSDFSDVAADAWYADAVGWAAKTGVVNGFEDGSFRPDASITREQLVVMLYRFAKLLALDTSAEGSLASFTDGANTSDWAREAMVWAVGAGIVKGDNVKALHPTTAATRAETACMVDRFLGLMK